VNGEDQELRAVHVWTEKDFRKQAVAIPIFLLGGIALIWLGMNRCVDYPFSRSPQTFLSGLIPIAGGVLLIALMGLGVRKRLREKKRSYETTA
jgi:chromate transport protein ChrA